MMQQLTLSFACLGPFNHQIGQAYSTLQNCAESGKMVYKTKRVKTVKRVILCLRLNILHVC